MSRRLAGAALAAVAAALAVGLLAPGGLDPKAWEPPPVAPETEATRLNQRLKDVEWLGKKSLPGPETLLFEDDGRVLTGLSDGRIVRFTVGRDDVELVADTKGRPLALAHHPTLGLVVCDAARGLLAVGPGGQVETLATEEGGVPFGVTDDLAVAPDGVVFFTDASSRHPLGRFVDDLLEHQPSGRLLAYEPSTKQVRRLAAGLSFANGVALGPDDAYLVVSETGTYRLWRFWLKGPKAGTRELFTDSLPGFPDNVRYSKERQVFWVAIGSPRKPELDALAGWPSLRRLIGRLPASLQPAPARHAYALAVDLSGRPSMSLQYDAPDSYSPVASVVEHDGWLYLGSFARDGYARVKLAP